MTRRPLLSVLLALLVMAFPVVAAQPAGAATGTYLRLAHLSPDTPAVDVLVTSFRGETVALDGVGYGDVSSYKLIEPGTYTVQMRLAGADRSSAPVVTGTLDAQEGAAYTAAGLGPRAALAVTVLADDLTLPAPGQARLRIVQGAERAGEVSVGWNGNPVAGRVPFGTATDYASVPAGPGTLEVTGASGPAARVPVELAGSGVYSVILVERDGGLDAEVQTDAVGPGDVPAGGIPTGLGGTADRDGGQPPVAATAGTATALTLVGLTLVGLAWVRRARVRPGR